jgi:ubiquinone/menaquinone biosynthesis C-methylase UbiE
VKDAVGVDLRRFPGVDVVADLDAALPFRDASLEALHSRHFLEHVDDLAAVLAEHFRVLAPGGEAMHVVPHFSNPYFYSDYTHRHFFGLYTFCYFAKRRGPFRREVPTFYNALDFEILGVELRFSSPVERRRWIKRLLQRLVNRSAWTQELFEERFCWIFPADEIAFRLRKPRESAR